MIMQYPLISHLYSSFFIYNESPFNSINIIVCAGQVCLPGKTMKKKMKNINYIHYSIYIFKIQLIQIILIIIYVCDY